MKMGLGRILPQLTSLLLYILNKGSCNDNYEKKIIPANYSMYDVNVNVRWILKIKGILQLSAKDMIFSVDVQLTTLWVDNQLTLTPNANLKRSPIILSTDVAQRLYFPRMKFINCKACDRSIIDPQKHSFSLFECSQNYCIYYTFRKEISFNCVFDLTRYPFDVQICKIDVMLMKHSEQNINLSLDADKKFYEKFDKDQLTMPSEFKLKHVEVTKTECKESDRDYSKATYDCFSYIFTFERTILQHILLIFLPSTLIVILSWVSFWLDVDLAASRVALGQTSLLTLAAQFNSVQNNLPPVSTVKALDVWMFACILMAFGSILEYALAYNCEKRSAPGKNKIGPYKKVMYRDEKKKCFIPSRSVDFWSKILFPLIFLIFNIAFWAVLFLY